MSDDSRDALGEEIAIEERTFANNKTPGIDGLSAEFYKFFWVKLKVLYLQAINCAIENDCLAASMRKGIITLIPKKDKNMLFLKNWRPLTMLTLDYKLYAKTLDRRMQTILPDIISQDHHTVRGSISISIK